MKLSALLGVLHSNTDLTIYTAKRVNGKCGYTLLKPLFKGKVRNCTTQDVSITHVFARGYNEVECYCSVDESEVQA